MHCVRADRAWVVCQYSYSRDDASRYSLALSKYKTQVDSRSSQATDHPLTSCFHNMHPLPLWYASIFALALGVSVAARGMQLHESRQLPQGFSSLGPAPLDTMLGMRMALAQTNFGGLVDSLMAVSEPTNPRYGQFLTKEEVRGPIVSTHSANSCVPVFCA